MGVRDWAITVWCFCCSFYCWYLCISVVLISVRSRLEIDEHSQDHHCKGVLFDQFDSCGPSSFFMCSILLHRSSPHLFLRISVSSSFSCLSSSPLFSLAVFVWGFVVWDAGKAGWLSREMAADSKHKTFDFGVRGCVLRYLTGGLPTPRPVWAAVSPDTMKHGRGEGGGGRRGG